MNKNSSYGKSLFLTKVFPVRVSIPYAETTLELPGWGGKIHACAVEDLVTITRGLKTSSIE